MIRTRRWLGSGRRNGFLPGRKEPFEDVEPVDLPFVVDADVLEVVEQGRLGGTVPLVCLVEQDRQQPFPAVALVVGQIEGRKSTRWSSLSRIASARSCVAAVRSLGATRTARCSSIAASTRLPRRSASSALTSSSWKYSFASERRGVVVRGSGAPGSRVLARIVGRVKQLVEQRLHLGRIAQSGEVGRHQAGAKWRSSRKKAANSSNASRSFAFGSSRFSLTRTPRISSKAVGPIASIRSRSRPGVIVPFFHSAVECLMHRGVEELSPHLQEDGRRRRAQQMVFIGPGEKDDDRRQEMIGRQRQIAVVDEAVEDGPIRDPRRAVRHRPRHRRHLERLAGRRAP